MKRLKVLYVKRDLAFLFAGPLEDQGRRSIWDNFFRRFAATALGPVVDVLTLAEVRGFWRVMLGL